MKINFIKKSPIGQFIYLLKSIALFVLIATSLQTPIAAQIPTYTQPSWWFGAAAGANFNFYSGSTQKLNADLTVPKTFQKGMGVGLFLAPLIEFHRPTSNWGVMLQVGYDGRSGKFKQVTNPCNCPADLSTKLSYITIELSLRFAPFKSHFYLFGGPRLAFNMSKSFTYKVGKNPEYPNQAANPDQKGDLSDVQSMIISMQIGAGYDFPISAAGKQNQFILSPFISFHPYFGQAPRSIETWNVNTLRVGVAFKFGRGSAVAPLENAKLPLPITATFDPEARLSVHAPANIPVERRVRETFPLRNYVFFDKGSSSIPNRYVLLTKSEVANFDETQLEVYQPKTLSGRSKRQMVVYYNILNILGNRMQNNPSATITLVGSSANGPADGKLMAESIKTYLVDVFEIDGARITTLGRDKPKIPSEKPGATQENELLVEGDRRVSIESSSAAMLMEFQSGPEAPLKPVEIVTVQEAPLDSYVTFDVGGGKEEYTSWSVEIKDDKGVVQNFGPYTKEKISIPGKSILGTRAQGNYKVTMVGTTKAGKKVSKDTTVHMVLWTPTKDEEGTRFSVIYEFNDSKAIAMYGTYLAEVVTPKIPKNGTVIIHGYTDIIGDEAYNQKLSLARANDVKGILESSLAKAGRNDVKFEVYGFGEDESLVPFENKYPEQRFYNRTVVIDIIPHE
jgi:outer membrane protein OmpA-like peptidoglycan-associated protein